MQPGVRDLLRRCCHACPPGEAHDCDTELTPTFREIGEPGAIDPVGPLEPGVQRRIDEIADREPTRCNRVRLLVDGVQSFTAMIERIHSARHSLLVENFIFRRDAVGLAFARELEARAGEGVDVRVLYDWIGSLSRFRGWIGARLRDSPVRAVAYNPPRPSATFFRSGRNHRKALVQDRERAVIGGVCLADLWMGNCIDHCSWRDSSVLVAGEAAAQIGRSFDDLWATPPTSELPVESAALGGGAAEGGQQLGEAVPVRVLVDEPRLRRTERVLLEILGAARSQVLLTNAYFVPTAPILRGLQDAAVRGVDVRLLLPGGSDHPILDRATEHLLGSLLEAGVRIWRWRGPMIHAKTIVVDGRWSLVGSTNLDSLSLRKNHELNLAIHGVAFGGQMTEMFAWDLERSDELTLDVWKSRGATRALTGRIAMLASAWL